MPIPFTRLVGVSAMWDGGPIVDMGMDRRELRVQYRIGI
jgi:hypothetical protein